MIDFELLQRDITRQNACDLLREVACPACGCVGRFILFDEMNNNGVGIQCEPCGKHHPFVRHRIMWLRGEDNRRSNDIVAVMNERGHYCYCCEIMFPQLKKFGIAMSVHHTRRFSDHGETSAKIPLCTVCHEHVNLMQRTMRRFVGAE